MNIVNKVTLRQLRKNKRRTLVTIIGVIISVAMLTAVSTIGVSFLDLLKRQTIADQGEWHVLYGNVNPEQIDAIQKDEETKTVVLSRDLGYALLEGSQNDYRPYLFVKEYNAHGFEQFPIELSSGRMPQAENEVVISEAIAKRAKVEYAIGDTLTLEVGQRIPLHGELANELGQTISLMRDQNGEIAEEIQNTVTKEFTVVGTIKTPSWEPTWAPGYTIISYLDESTLAAEDTVNATVVLKKVKGSLFDHAEQFAEQHQIDEIQYNNELLRYYGVIKNDGTRTTLYSLVGIIMTIIVIGSVSLIYNAFAISVSERSRHLGMLSSVGATKIQKRNSVFFEGAVIGLISIPLGIIFGLLGMGITFLFINTAIQGAFGVSEKLQVTVTSGSIIAAIIVSIVTIFISTFIPARRASRISAMDAIRQTEDIKLTGRAVKTSKLVRILFGIEAEIGLKNLKRNKRRYQATVFSLVISILLFLSVSYFTENLKKSVELTQSGQNFDIFIELAHEGDDQFAEAIISMDEVTQYSIVTSQTVTSWIDQEKAGDVVKQLEGFSSQLENGKYPYVVELLALDDESLQSYANEVGADYDILQNGLHGILIDTIQYEDANAGKYVEAKNVHVKIGDQLDLYTHDWEKEEDVYLDKIEVVTLTDTLPMGEHFSGLGLIKIIVSEATLTELMGEDVNPSMLYLNSDDPMKTQEKIEEIENVRHYMHNVYKYRQQEEQMILIMSVFTYGFIILITAISIANILNTISTSISLRKREFAMLKSVGMTPKGFNKMINYESIFYGIKALLYGLPLSILAMYLMYRALSNSFEYAFTLPWLSILYVIISVFLIVGISMLYSSSKVKKENIIDALKQENI